VRAGARGPRGPCCVCTRANAASQHACFSQPATPPSRCGRSLVVALSLTMVIFLLELFGFWSGLTTFAHGHNFMHVLFHVAGCIAVCVFIIEGSHYVLYWFYFALFSAVPGVLEISRITSVALVRKQW